MNRRSFLQSVGAVGLASALPASMFVPTISKVRGFEEIGTAMVISNATVDFTWADATYKKYVVMFGNVEGDKTR